LRKFEDAKLLVTTSTSFIPIHLPTYMLSGRRHDHSADETVRQPADGKVGRYQLIINLESLIWFGVF